MEKVMHSISCQTDTLEIETGSAERTMQDVVCQTATTENQGSAVIQDESAKSKEASISNQVTKTIMIEDQSRDSLIQDKPKEILETETNAISSNERTIEQNMEENQVYHTETVLRQASMQ